MVLFDEYSTEKLDKVLKDFNRYFRLIDKDFFNDFEHLREEIRDRFTVYSEGVPITGDLAGKEIPFEEAVTIASEVFESVNPRYKDMFLNMINNPRFVVKYGKQHIVSNNLEITLTGSIDDVLILVHEFAHNFVYREDGNFFLSLFDEVNAVFWEKIAIDYLSSRYNTFVNYDGVRLRELINGRTMHFKKFYVDIFSKSKDGFDKDGFFEVYRNTNVLARHFLDSYLLMSRNGITTFFFGEYIHDLGFLLANSMYQDYLSNPDSIYKLYDVEKMNASDDSYLKEGLTMLFKDDIPITHNGKISLKGDNYSRLMNSLQGTLKRDKQLQKTS